MACFHCYWIRNESQSHWEDWLLQFPKGLDIHSQWSEVQGTRLWNWKYKNLLFDVWYSFWYDMKYTRYIVFSGPYSKTSVRNQEKVVLLCCFCIVEKFSSVAHVVSKCNFLKCDFDSTWFKVSQRKETAEKELLFHLKQKSELW